MVVPNQVQFYREENEDYPVHAQQIMRCFRLIRRQMINVWLSTVRPIVLPFVPAVWERYLATREYIQ